MGLYITCTYMYIQPARTVTTVYIYLYQGHRKVFHTCTAILAPPIIFTTPIRLIIFSALPNEGARSSRVAP